MEKISYKQLDKYIRSCNPIEKVNIGTEEDPFEIEIKKYLTTTEKAELCARVVAQVFADGEYNPYVQTDVMHAAKIEYYTNIKTDNLTPERLGWLIGYARLCNKINCVAWDSDEVDAIIDRAIEDRRCEIREKRAHDINALMDMVKALIDRFEHVGETLEGADIPALLGDIQKIANMDDEQRVRNVLTVHQESDGNS